MTVRVNKDSFNLREKLSELDYAHVPYEKMPPGSVLQIATVRHRRSSGGQTLDQNYAEITGGTHVDSDSVNFEVTIYPRLATSRIIIQGSSHWYIVSNTSAPDWSGVIYRIAKYVDDVLIETLMSGGNYDESIYVSTTTQRSMGNKPIFGFDTPGTTGKVTYKIEAKAQTAAHDVNMHNTSYGPGGFLMATEIKRE